MAYCYDNLKLEKGMYHEAGRSFTQVLESRDPSEQYRGTALEGLDAFQRQLKRSSALPTPPCCSRSISPARCARVWRRRTCCPSSPPR